MHTGRQTSERPGEAPRSKGPREAVRGRLSPAGPEGGNRQGGNEDLLVQWTPAWADGGSPEEVGGPDLVGEPFWNSLPVPHLLGHHVGMHLTLRARVTWNPSSRLCPALQVPHALQPSGSFGPAEPPALPRSGLQGRLPADWQLPVRAWTVVGPPCGAHAL